MSGKGSFQDLLVVELASVLAGPSVGQFFAEMGATVIKVENLRTSGDVTRSWKLSTEPPEAQVSAYFASANWGKQSVCVDLTSQEVREALYSIIKKADVVLVSFKPGDAEKLQMDYERLSTMNSSLIYGHVTGYGKDVPRAGYDAVLQAEAGFMYLNGEPDGPPVKMPVALIDLLAAHQLKEGMLAALYLRERTGKGQYVEVSLLRTAIASLANQATNFLVAGKAPERMGSEHPNIVPYGTVFKTADHKELVLAIGDDRQFKTLCQVLGAPELADRPEFRSNKDRVRHRSELKPLLKELIAGQERESLLQTLIDNHVPAGAVHTIPEALRQPLAQPQILSSQGMLGVRQIAFQVAGGPELTIDRPPLLGQHTWHVLTAVAGLKEEQLHELAQNQLIYPYSP
ncbi:CaiB/BaiF CoA transferase family protein [Rufibacter roseus]|uniref:CaiB/BaiF CoA transferase family protein n=1 Tax=Rufibacter roseus TaxID=1567108 RepID=A0ABW2DMJ6_9BACT|nr:CaiB/BaiF CoA-transferase family protein [Rufibacter roseus]